MNIKGSCFLFLNFSIGNWHSHFYCFSWSKFMIYSRLSVSRSQRHHYLSEFDSLSVKSRAKIEVSPAPALFMHPLLLLWLSCPDENVINTHSHFHCHDAINFPHEWWTFNNLKQKLSSLECLHSIIGITSSGYWMRSRIKSMSLKGETVERTGVISMENSTCHLKWEID